MTLAWNHPADCGARCDICPLKGQTPVKPDHFPDAKVLVIGQEPGPAEVRAGRSFVGPAGQLLDKALLAAGKTRFDVTTTNVVACQPPGGDIKAFEAKLVTVNRRRIANGEEPIPYPSDCCAPRLDAEMAGFDFIIPAGTVALNRIVKTARGGISKNRGMILSLPTAQGTKKILPIYNPAAVLRDPQDFVVLVSDLARAWRWFENRLAWSDPVMIFRPTPAAVEHALFGPYHAEWMGRKVHWYDVETDSIHAMTARLRCIGIGTQAWAMCIPLLGRDGVTRFYSDDEQRDILGIVRRWSTDPNIVKMGWNAGTYDRIVMQSSLGLNPRPFVDDILVHRNVEPSFEHSLAFVGSHWSDVHNWKADYRGSDTKTDEEEWKYNCLDVVTNARVHLPLWSSIEARNAAPVVALDHVMQDVCVGMHENGMFIDQDERDRQDVKVKGDAVLWLTRARKLLQVLDVDLTAIVKRTKKDDQRALELRRELGQDDRLSSEEQEEGWTLPTAGDLGLDVLAFNPLSHPQLRHVLFDIWNLNVPSNMKEKELYTSSGEISTGDAVLRRFLMGNELTEGQRAFIHSVRMARRWAKLWGTYIHPARPWEGDARAWRAHLGAVGHLRAESGPYPPMSGNVWSDGRVHPTWNCHTPITGRFASAGPNAQNWTGGTKTMVVAPPGRSLVGADFDQIEFRVAASRWGAVQYLDAFEKKMDPYQITMQVLFGMDRMMRYAGAPSKFGAKDFQKKTQFEFQRKVAKMVHLACQYGASLETVYRLVTSAEDKETGKLEMAHLTMAEVAVMFENWRKGCPEYVKGWATEQAAIKQYGYMVEPVTGRRRDYAMPGKNLSEEVNFAIQASAAALMNTAMAEIVREIPHQRWGVGTGFINQCHDAVTIECPESEAEYVRDVMNQAMNRSHAAFPGVRFSATAEIGPRTAKTNFQSRWSET